MDKDVETARRVLIRVRERIADPAHWTQFAAARNALQRAVNPNDASAVCWCITGAIEAEVNTDIQRDAIVHGLEKYVRPQELWVWEFNDTNTHTDVMSMLDCAISDLS